MVGSYNIPAFMLRRKGDDQGSKHTIGLLGAAENLDESRWDSCRIFDLLLMSLKHGAFLVQEKLVLLSFDFSLCRLTQLLRRIACNPWNLEVPFGILKLKMIWIELPSLSDRFIDKRFTAYMVVNSLIL